MNGVVLAIAGLLIVAGLCLIALSIVLAKNPSVPEESPPAAPEFPADSDDPGLFIDQPLETDMSTALGHTTTSPEETGSTGAVPIETAPSRSTDDDPTEEGPAIGLRTANDIDGSTRPDKED